MPLRIRQLPSQIEAERLRVTECKKQEDSAYSAIIQNQIEYDKQILALSAAFIAAILAFLKQVIPVKQIVWAWALYCSLGSLAVAVFVVILSYQLSIVANDEAMKYWQDEYKKASSGQFPYRLAKVVRYTNVASGSCFVAGLILAIIFAAINIQTERQNMTINKSGHATDGMPVRLPAKPTKPSESGQKQTDPAKPGKKDS